MSICAPDSGSKSAQSRRTAPEINPTKAPGTAPHLAVRGKRRFRSPVGGSADQRNRNLNCSRSAKWPWMRRLLENGSEAQRQ